MKLKAPWKKTFLKEINYERKTPWEKSYDKPRQYINSRDITLLTKVCIVKAMIFPAIIYGYENWTIKKAEWQRIDAFELWLWRKFSRVPWTARQLNQSILKKKKKSTLNIHWKDWCWNWSSDNLASWCKQLTCWERPWVWERLKTEGEGDHREWDGWMASPMQSTWILAD